MSEGHSHVQKVQAEGYGDMVIKHLNSLRSNSELCDFKVSAEGKVFEVHKGLLAATSDYFRVMFSGVMAESRQDTVDLKGVTADGLQHLIDFIYSGELALQFDNLTEIINTASHLQVSCALDVCSNYIKSLMTFDNAEDFLNIADTYSLEKVQTHWQNMILNNFFEFSQTQACMKLDAESLVHYLSLNSLRTSSEYKLFQCLEKWFRHSSSRISNDSAKILSQIRFPLMTQIELSALQENEIIKRSPGVQQMYIAKGYQYHIDCKEGHPIIDQSSTVRCDMPCLILVHHGTSYLPFQITAYDNNTGMFFRLFSAVNGSRDCRLSAVDNFAYICRVVDFGGGTLMNSLYRFDPRHLVGQELHPMRRLRMDFALVAFKGKLYVFGGSTETYAIMDSVECYNVRTNTWEDTLPLPVPTHSLAAVVKGDKIYISGGVSGQDRQATNSFISFYPATATYDSKPGLHFARRLHDMVTFEEKIFVMGGLPRQSTPVHGQIPIEYFDFHTNQWTMLSSTLSGRSVGHYVDFERQIISLGHEHHDAAEDEIWLYDGILDGWSKYAKAPQRLTLTTAMCCMLKVNFFDEKVVKTYLKEK